MKIVFAVGVAQCLHLSAHCEHHSDAGHVMFIPMIRMFLHEETPPPLQTPTLQ